METGSFPALAVLAGCYGVVGLSIEAELELGCVGIRGGLLCKGVCGRSCQRLKAIELGLGAACDAAGARKVTWR